MWGTRGPGPAAPPPPPRFHSKGPKRLRGVGVKGCTWEPPMANELDSCYIRHHTSKEIGSQVM